MPELKRYRVLVSRHAACQLKDHSRFAAQLSEHYAVKLMDDFRAAAQSLSHMPFRAPLLQSEGFSEQSYRKLLFGTWYIMIYRIQEDTVHIEYVVDGRQDYKWMLQ